MRMVAFLSPICINDSDVLRIITVTNYAYKNKIWNYSYVATFTKKKLQSRLCTVLLPTCSFFYIGQIHTHFTVFTFDFLLPLSVFSSTVGIVFRVSTQNPRQMSLHKSESKARLSFLSKKTSSLDCSTGSTTQNITPQKSLCSPLSFLSLQTLSLDCCNTTLHRMPHHKNLCVVLSPFCRYRPYRLTAVTQHYIECHTTKIFV